MVLKFFIANQGSVHRNSMRPPNHRGFVLISLCLLLPLFLFVAHSVGWIFWFQKSKEESEYICHQHLLRAQNHLIQGTDQLLTLNPLARAYTIEKLALKAALKAAPAAAKIPIALAIQKVISLQILLKVQQQGILGLANTKALLEVRTLRNKLKRHLIHMSESWGAKNPSRPNIQFSLKAPQVRIIYKDIAPQYGRKFNYAKVQEIKFWWSQKLHPNVSQNFYLKNKKRNWIHQCFTHPRQRRNQWQANLGRAKY